MVFVDKPKTLGSKLIKDKRTLSLLNTDFKTLTGLETKRHNSVLDHTVSQVQFAVGKTMSIWQAVALARDAIFATSKSKKEGAIADLDFVSAFNLLCMDWVEKVLRKKGLDENTVLRINRIYMEGVTVPVVNGVFGEPIRNTRRTLRQGDCPSSIWFSYGIDPLLD